MDDILYQEFRLAHLNDAVRKLTPPTPSKKKKGKTDTHEIEFSVCRFGVFSYEQFNTAQKAFKAFDNLQKKSLGLGRYSITVSHNNGNYISFFIEVSSISKSRYIGRYIESIDENNLYLGTDAD